LALIAEALDSRIKTAADLERATGLPVLASLGDLGKLKPEEQVNWAFRTLTLLQGKLNSASDETLVCGIISSHHGEGRSTWINLLTSAASQRGMRVLTVATKPSKAADEDWTEVRPKSAALLPMGPATTLTKNVLAFPTQVTEQFSDPQAQPVVHIPLPGWVWNLERRQQWRTALDHWQDIQNLVLLIELPPACQPESVLLAEHLPQVIWLASSGMAEVEETRTQLETLRHARCNLVGAVLNREPSSSLRKQLAKWARRLSLLAVTAAVSLQAAQPGSEPAAIAAQKATSLSVTNPNERPHWLQRLTLGPGDAFDITVFGHPDLSRTNLVVGPDGTLSFLQVQDLPVSGLTVDELRARLDEQLGKFFVGGARTIVVPANYASKKYYLLGKVVTEGVFTLDRPLTIIEAVARAKGLQTGTSERNTGEIADLTHSFLVREGKRMPVDLERLFREGDLSQNIALEPNDYLYFAPAEVHEIYVLGEVFSPGAVSVGSDATITGALSARGGFTERAYRKRVLVVRGSLQRPEAYAIDTPAILAGRIPDFRLQPRDIVYVNARPWIRVEELLDIAAQAFIEASVTEWAGAYVPAVFTSPVVPHP
jgi:protein involved in polysaccharide export with SLBB domain